MTAEQTYARELGDFLRARRQRTTPEDLGLEPGPRRKVDGLRREEVAMLAGLSTDYYQRLEQGRNVRPSDAVLDSLADALELDEIERRHMLMLARATRQPAAPPVRRRQEAVPASTARLLAHMGVPAVVLGRHLDLLAWNDLAATLLGDPEAYPPERRNFLTALFDEEGMRLHCADWETTALDYIGMLRTAVAADPDHPRAVALVGELSIRSAEFRRLWARHDVRESVHGAKLIHHPRVGDIAMEWDAYPLPGSPGPVMVVFTPQPGAADDQLRLLGSLSDLDAG
ncbi:helix-turn-helix transcriptional regulator [Promicromonospora sp. MEB111]|uniref:helix-turn-helix transcriptional regulator n=1 Tax=Promicromonospora sp. MEB111 TaxID=3040301 RepID=UPI00254B46AF|nr:helix-turn-helix transcriptional regulator [Promicromonospora sp. MEB111]